MGLGLKGVRKWEEENGKPVLTGYSWQFGYSSERRVKGEVAREREAEPHVTDPRVPEDVNRAHHRDCTRQSASDKTLQP